MSHGKKWPNRLRRMQRMMREMKVPLQSNYILIDHDIVM